MRVEILAVDLAHAHEARPDLSQDTMIPLALERGLSLARQPAEARVPHDIPPHERLTRLRALFATTAAIVAEMRTRLIMDRERFADAAVSERSSYIEHVELDRDVVPPLKLEAKRLRETVRRLEAEAESLGIDVDAVEPRIDWTTTLAVDTYEPTRYVSNEDRRRTAVEFFRRLDER